jgi:Fe2+ transport system protein B
MRCIMAIQHETVIHLTGNPYCGMTTLFNRLPGARQTVGNYPGVTVETVAGTMVRAEKIPHRRSARDLQSGRPFR